MAFQILSLSGGGYLGLFSACVLAELERQNGGEPIARRFDLIAGTSIGGIIALGLAAEVPAADIVREFTERGSRIFSERRRPKGFFGHAIDLWRFFRQPKYDGVELRKAVTALLGDRMLGEAAHRVLIPAVNMTKGSIQMFKTPHDRSFLQDHALKMVDIAMATSAAPTYFPLADLGSARFADGGLFANAPDLCALHEATHFLGAAKEDVSILSIGTTTSKFSLAHATTAELGAVQWVEGGRLWATMSAAQQQLVDFLLKHQLGDQRYFRIDDIQSPEQEADLALDVATKDATATIIGLAKGAYQTASAKPLLQQMMRHRPDATAFYYGPNANA